MGPKQPTLFQSGPAGLGGQEFKPMGHGAKTSTQPTPAKRKKRRTRKRKRQVLNNPPIPIKFNNANKNNSIQPNPIIDPKFPAVYNIAEVPLSIPEKELLQRGLKFCPNLDKPIHSDYLASIDELHRKVLIKGYFMAQDTTDTDMDTQHKQQSNYPEDI
jgi:hypothetical protein